MHQPLPSDFGVGCEGHISAPQQPHSHASLAHNATAGILMVPLDPHFCMDAFPTCRAPPSSPSAYHAAAAPSTHHGPALSDLSTHLETLAQGPGMLSPLAPPHTAAADPRELSFTINAPTLNRKRGLADMMSDEEENGDEAVSRLVKPRPAQQAAGRGPSPEHSHGSNLPSPDAMNEEEWEQEAPERRWNGPFVPFDFHQRAMDHEE